MNVDIRSQLATKLPGKLVDELLEAYSEAKRNWFLGGLRLSAVEGGRFCEAAFRLLEHITQGTSTPIGTHLSTERVIQKLEQLPGTSHPDAVRIHIPRALRLVYDIRNKRDAAHLADGIDPNLQDATLVTSVLDWVLAEFVRLYHKVSADVAQHMVLSLVTRAIPAVQDFGGFLKVLNPRLPASSYCLVLLYQRGSEGATLEELANWARCEMRANLQRTLTGLVENKALAHFSAGRYFITRLGERHVESRRLLEPVAGQ